MSSLGDIQAIYVALQEIDRLLIDINAKADVTSTRMMTLGTSFIRVESVALRYLALSRRMGLPDDVDHALRILSQTLVMLRMMQITVNLLLTGGAGGFLAIATTAMAGASLISLAGETR